MCSGMSEMTINYGDEEVPLDEAVDGIFKDLQLHINEVHVQIRNMCQLVERDDEYDEIYAFYSEMVDHIKDGSIIFKDLVKVMKQVIGKPPKGWIDPKKRNQPLEPVTE